MPPAKKTAANPITGPKLVKNPTRKVTAQPAETPLRARIEQRAYALFLDSGGVDGYDVEHWLTAEQEILGAAAPAEATPTMASRARR